MSDTEVLTELAVEDLADKFGDAFNVLNLYEDEREIDMDGCFSFDFIVQLAELIKKHDEYTN